MSTNDILRDYFQKSSKTDTVLADDDPLLSSGLLDSLAIVKLLGFIDTEFGVTVEDADFDPDNFESISTIGTLIDRMRG